MQGLFGDLLKTKVALRQCPITGGNQTRMAEASFRKLCELRQAKARGENRNINDTANYAYCLECLGSIKPQGLEFVDLNNFK